MAFKSFGKAQMAAAFLGGALFFSGLSWAAESHIPVSFPKLKFFVNGVDQTPASDYDNNGTKVPAALVYEGTTYVPVRLVGGLVTQSVYWDGNASAISIGTPYTELVTPTGEKVGSAALTQTPTGVKIEVKASNLTPGKHGFHIHENAIQGADFKTAGGHFNPVGKKHGADNPEGAHLGDLTNIEAKTDGTAQAVLDIVGATLEKGKPNSIAGKSLIIHAKEDDFKTDPSGNSGDRIAGGNIPE